MYLTTQPRMSLGQAETPAEPKKESAIIPMVLIVGLLAVLLVPQMSWYKTRRADIRSGRRIKKAWKASLAKGK